MKILTIVRHAKAEKPEAYPTDYERPLTARGVRDAERLAGFLAHIEPPVTLILSSPAARAAQTADRLAAGLGYASAVTWQEGIYLAAPDSLLTLLKTVPDEVEHALLVGHNPGLEDLVAGLSSGAPENGVVTLATAAAAQLTCDVNRWGQLRWGLGRLRLLVTAKGLK